MLRIISGPVRASVITEWGMERRVLGNGIDHVRIVLSHETLINTGEPLAQRRMLINAIRDIRDELVPDCFRSRFWRFISDQLYDWL